jgi:5-methylcytosine-specific restriction endonuclease McrBC GTP-binding regulatory subunit McrB
MNEKQQKLNERDKLKITVGSANSELNFGPTAAITLNLEVNDEKVCKRNGSVIELHKFIRSNINIVSTPQTPDNTIIITYFLITVCIIRKLAPRSFQVKQLKIRREMYCE